MKRRFSLVIVFVAVIGLIMGAFTVHAATKDKVDLTGDWHLWLLNSSEHNFIMSLNTDVNGNPTYVLKQDGDQLVCAAKGKFGELTVQGTIKDNDVEMTGTLGKVDIRFKGMLEEGKINGIVILGFNEANFMMKRK